MKLIVVPRKLEQIKDYLNNGCSGIIVGLKDLSTNYELALSLEQIEQLRHDYADIDLFVAMNKNFFNDELPVVEESLKKLDALKVSGVLFYDLAVLYLKKKDALNIDLVWNQTHMVTNYNTCNYYYDLGVKYDYLASEITLEEINEIREKTDSKLMALAYGCPVMAHSRRTLLTNYFHNRQKEYDGKPHHVFDENNRFIVKEDETGTTFLNDQFINGTCLILDSKIDYAIIDPYSLDDDKALKLVFLVSSLMENRDERIVKEIEELIGNNTNFFFKKTIFMVKKNEK